MHKKVVKEFRRAAHMLKRVERQPKIMVQVLRDMAPLHLGVGQVLPCAAQVLRGMALVHLGVGQVLPCAAQVLRGMALMLLCVTPLVPYETQAEHRVNSTLSSLYTVMHNTLGAMGAGSCWDLRVLASSLGFAVAASLEKVKRECREPGVGNHNNIISQTWKVSC